MPTRKRSTLRVPIPQALGFLLTPPLGRVRYRVAYGGRGSAKSWSFARALLLRALQAPLRVGCFREFQTSIADSVLQLLDDQIGALRLRRFFRVQQTEVRGGNGSLFLFKGLHRNVSGIRSLEGLDLAWIEEAQNVSDDSWETLIPTIRAPGSEIWVSFNPDLETDPTYQRFIVNPPPRSLIRKISYRDNPFLPAVLKEEAATLLARDPEAYETVWGGEPWRRSKAEVLQGKWKVEEFEARPGWLGPFFGADWGFSQDPTVLVRCWVDGDRLLVDYEASGIQLDADATARKFAEIPGATRHRIYADSARPETINEMRRHHFQVEPAPKWSGSVLDGIAHLRSYGEIVIHPRCQLVAREARLWRYKTDKQTGEPLPRLVPGNDHAMDALRYALSPRVRRSRPREVWYPGMGEEETSE